MTTTTISALMVSPNCNVFSYMFKRTFTLLVEVEDLNQRKKNTKCKEDVNFDISRWTCRIVLHVV